MWMSSSYRSTPSVGRTSSTGTPASVPGQVVGSRPPDSTAPPSTSASACPYCSPPNQVSTIAATSCRQGISTGDPEFTTTTVRGLDRKSHTSELQSRFDLVCRLLLEKKKNNKPPQPHNVTKHKHESAKIPVAIQ